MRRKRRRFTGTTFSGTRLTKPTPKVVAKVKEKAEKQAPPKTLSKDKSTKEKRRQYSCPQSVMTKRGKRLDVTTVPAEENRKAVARCYTASAWTPEMEESMPELSRPRDSEWASIPVELLDSEGEEEYNPELDPDNI
jgi:hypothetical protein